jgi:V/A-type H+-transporting ATPase subunit I
MRKLRVITLEDDVDAVVRSLEEAGIVQFIDMREKSEEWDGILASQVVSTEVLTKCSDLLSKIDASFENLGLKHEEIPSKEIPITKEPIEEVLAKVEQKLAELPVEALAKCSALTSRITQLIENLAIKPEETKEVTLKKPVEESLAEIEYELSEIEKTAETTDLIDRQAMVDRIKTVAAREEIDVHKKLDELARVRILESKRFFAKRLSALKKLVDMTRESIETETKLEKTHESLLTFRKIVEIEKLVAEEQKKFVRSAKTIYFEAWVPEYNVKEAIEKIKQVTGGTSIITDDPPAPDEKVPIILKPVPSYLIAFEKLVYTFGFPSSGDVNPVRVLAMTFPLLFGIMFADVGQGAIFVIMGIILTFLRRRIKLEEVGDIIQYLLISGEMFVFLGISAIFFGFIFGEFFGPSGMIHPIFLGKIGPFYIGGYEPTQEPMKMLRFAIFIGAIHISLGLVFRLISEIRHKHYKLAPIPICWLWLLIGGMYMWAYWRGISNISMWFAEGSLMLAGLIILPLALILVFAGIAEGFMEAVGFSVEVFAETLSHSMSYGRLMALGLIHSAMNYMFLVLAGVEHGYFPLQSIPIIAMGTILVMIIEGLVVFVHTLRLHWVEWFSKFHKGEGIPFKPFRYS